MPLAHYGVLKANFVSFGPDEQGQWYHGIINAEANGIAYQCAVDVESQNNVQVQYQVLHNLPSDVFAPILGLADGYTELARNPTSGALDYVRSQFLSAKGCLTVFWFFWQRLFGVSPWTSVTGTEAITAMDQLVSGCDKIYVFGEPYSTGNGMHNVHMNQGDPPISPDGRDHQGDDGIWQDGGVVVHKDGKLHAFISKFSSQTLNTDDQGLPA